MNFDPPGSLACWTGRGNAFIICQSHKSGGRANPELRCRRQRLIAGAHMPNDVRRGEPVIMFQHILDSFVDSSLVEGSGELTG
jgi:hypothetical protein